VTSLVSVIIPCRNGAETLSETLASVIGSALARDRDHRRREPLRRRKRRRRPRGTRAPPWALAVVETDASGINAAREAGYALSRGDYVQWLDADDTIDPDKIERQLLALEASPGHDVAHGDWVWEITVPDLRAGRGRAN
jgi:glycosyltransferase involved in cell wall biosynthesis